MTTLETHHCPGCGGERPFEVPPCADADAHALDDCPDLACTSCGYALAGAAAPAWSPATLPRAA